MKKKSLLVLGIVIASLNIGGCASIAKEVVKQVLQNQEEEDKDGNKEKDKDSREDSAEEGSDREGNSRNRENDDQDSKDNQDRKDAQDNQDNQGSKDAQDHQDNQGSRDAQDHQDNQGSENAQDSQEGKGSRENAAGSYDAFIHVELETQLGILKNHQFSYGFERNYTDGTDYFYARPMKGALDSGIVSTYRRDLNKDGRDELLVFYIEGSKDSVDGENHFLLRVYGNTGNAITEWGRVGFDNCFSRVNGEEYLFGLKDVGNKCLIYMGENTHVWTWADGNSPEIHLYQLEGSQLREIYQADSVGSDDSWLPRWKSDLRGLGFDLPSLNWNETNLAGESGFEVLAYAECYTKDQGPGNNYAEQQYWLDYGLVVGEIYKPDSQTLVQMNSAMQPYSGSNSSVPGAQGNLSSQVSAYGTGDYILPNSSSTYLTRADLAGLSQEQLRLARNEIYARHGRKFKTREIQEYFNSKSWYTGTIESDAFKDDYLNIYEKENIKLIQSLEN